MISKMEYQDKDEDEIRTTEGKDTHKSSPSPSILNTLDIRLLNIRFR